LARFCREASPHRRVQIGQPILWVVGPQTDRRPEKGHGGERSPALHLENAEVVETLCMVRIAGEDAAIERFGLSQIAGVVLGDGLLQGRVDGLKAGVGGEFVREKGWQRRPRGEPAGFRPDREQRKASNGHGSGSETCLGFYRQNEDLFQARARRRISGRCVKFSRSNRRPGQR
jgi:hypothetical protein